MTGVRAVQNRTSRHYTEEEIETLETIVMIIENLSLAEALLVLTKNMQLTVLYCYRLLWMMSG